MTRNTRKPERMMYEREGAGRLRPVSLRRVATAWLLSLSIMVVACTPAEIEMSINRITVSFEQGGVESGLASAIFVAEYAIPIIGMRLGSLSGMEP